MNMTSPEGPESPALSHAAEASTELLGFAIPMKTQGLYPAMPCANHPRYLLSCGVPSSSLLSFFLSICFDRCLSLDVVHLLGTSESFQVSQCAILLQWSQLFLIVS
jgi:hypothetical protein